MKVELCRRGNTRLRSSWMTKAPCAPVHATRRLLSCAAEVLGANTGLPRESLEEISRSIQAISPQSVDPETLPLSEPLQYSRCRPPTTWPLIQHEAHQQPFGNKLAGIERRRATRRYPSVDRFGFLVHPRGGACGFER